MTRGGRAALLATVALGGCVSTSGVKVRAVADPISALRSGDDLAVARGQLALKNVGLALEAFRKAQRARPSDPAPLVGLADCYSVMGRYDLAQSNYEAALALAPRDPRLLLGLARVFEFQGNLDRAAQARLEAQQYAAVTAPVASASVTVALPPARPAPARTIAAAKPATTAPQPAPSVTVKLPPARPVEQPAQLASAVAPAPPPAQPVTAVVAIKAAPPAPQAVELAALTPAPQRDLSMDVAMSAPPAEVTVATKVPLLQAEPITLDPPVLATESAAAEPPTVEAPRAPQPPRLEMTVADVAPRALTKLQAAQLSSLAPQIAIDIPPPAPTPREQPKPITDMLPAQPASPRLVRLSPGEVALVTTGQPAWNGKASAKSAQMAAIATVRWVPLSQPGRAPNVQVLNAARSQGIAASARSILTDRGWRRIAIGDAPTVRQTSVVLYPKERAKLGRSLARQFGIKARMIAGKSLVVLLGRDKVGAIKAQRNA